MSLIPPFYMNTVVAIGYKDSVNKEATWSASGFFYSKTVQQERANRKKATYLITNRHVLSDRSEVILRLNPQGKEAAIEVPLSLKRMTLHPKVDVGVVPVDFDLLLKHKFNSASFESNIHTARLARMAELGVSEGDFVYALGFPMSLVGPGEFRSAVLVRHGCIARLRDTLERHSSSFLVDTFSFPGNSGGPVIIKPEAYAIEGTEKSVKAALLVGVLAANLFYKDTAVSSQTNRPRITFEENAGLGVVYPVDYIDECIALNEAGKTHASKKIGRERRKPGRIGKRRKR